MAAKRPSLTESMSKVRQAPVQVIEAAPPMTTPAVVVSAPRAAATREGMKRATALLSPEEHRRLKRLSIDTDKTVEELLHEAVTDLLQKHGA